MARVHDSKIGTRFSVPKVNPATQNLRHNQWPHAKGYLDRSDALQCYDQQAKCEVELRHASWTASKHLDKDKGQQWNAMDSFSRSRNWEPTVLGITSPRRRHWTLGENWTWCSLFSLILILNILLFFCCYCSCNCSGCGCWVAVLMHFHLLNFARITALLFFRLSFAPSLVLHPVPVCPDALILFSCRVEVCNAPCPNRHLPKYQRKQKQQNQDVLATIKS